MKIYVTGTRGIPDIPGGVETHCQNLYPLIVARGHEVHVATRSSYVRGFDKGWNGIKLVKCFAPRLKSIEAIVHTFIAIIKARLRKPDVVHIHAVGPGLFVPFARLLGLKVVFTTHGPDYDRQKWGKAAKAVLRLGEKLGGMFANEVITISNVTREIIKRRCGRPSHLIPNGVHLADPASDTDYLESLGVKPQRYILAVARFVPEKGLTDLIEAYAWLGDNDYSLVIAGDADHETYYSLRVKELAMTTERVLLTGYITGRQLQQIYTHAKLFVLPSYHEGLPIALLEALSYGLPVLVSDIPANREVEIDRNRFFSPGDIDDLVGKMRHFLPFPVNERQKEQAREMVAEKYDWQRIAEQTLEVYRSAIGIGLIKPKPVGEVKKIEFWGEEYPGNSSIGGRLTAGGKSATDTMEYPVIPNS